ncbi:MAG: CHC2 zinc finger domain-containing protein [Methylococcaceae bacterium]
MNGRDATRQGYPGGKKNKLSPKLDVNFIKNSITPLDFFTHELPNAQLKNHGWTDGGLCPFHWDNKPGSFMVNVETGAFICFSCGVKGGDIISFTMLRHALDFIEALKTLAGDWGLL